MNKVYVCQLCKNFEVPFPYDDAGFNLMQRHIMSEHRSKVELVIQDNKFVLRRKKGENGTTEPPD